MRCPNCEHINSPYFMVCPSCHASLPRHRDSGLPSTSFPDRVVARLKESWRNDYGAEPCPDWLISYTRAAAQSAQQQMSQISASTPAITPSSVSGANRAFARTPVSVLIPSSESSVAPWAVFEDPHLRRPLSVATESARGFMADGVISTCAICLSNESRDNNPLRKTSCGHWFHNNCLQNWQRSGKPNFNLCPSCRQQLF